MYIGRSSTFHSDKEEVKTRLECHSGGEDNNYIIILASMSLDLH
jgi:hypothetical protein